MTEQLPSPDSAAANASTTANAASTAYALLSKPIEDITDADLEVIITDLRRRRMAYKSGKDDRPDKPKAAAAGPVTEGQKDLNTASILASLDLKL